ncbi:MAG: low molecular weight protein arginine phosphatase [Planctomycetota bacterium]
MNDPTPTTSGSAPLRTVLFVCTGNTCRSPMAQAIAEDLLRHADGGDGIFIASAGVAAGSGAPMTLEAEEALEKLGVPIIEHRSTPLSAPMVGGAHAVFGLTASHVDAIRSIAPDAGETVAVLDPTGQDVPDPIGAGLDVYLETARRLRTLVAHRLRELNVELDAGVNR